MNDWIERQRHLLDFTLTSLARRKTKNIGLLVVFTLLVFVLASVSLYTQALRSEAQLVHRACRPPRTRGSSGPESAPLYTARSAFRTTARTRHFQRENRDGI